jgi:tRNA-2-methylthio-N6-dimethylallyladenosine synthase
MQVPEDKKNIRLQELQKLLSEQQKTVQEDMIGRTVTVLFEKTGRQSGQVVGKSDYLHAVHVPGDQNKVGLLESVLITGSNTNSLQGKIV